MSEWAAHVGGALLALATLPQAARLAKTRVASAFAGVLVLALKTRNAVRRA